MARWVAEGEERSRSFARKAEAEAHLRQVVTEIETGTYADPRRGGTLFAVVAEQWIANTEATAAPTTVAMYRSVLERVVLPKWGGRALSDIGHAELQAWLTWLRTDPAARTRPKKVAEGEPAGLSASRVTHAHQVTAMILDAAVAARLIAVSPARGLALPRKAAPRSAVLSSTDIERLASTAEGIGELIEFLGLTGVRIGEALALRVGDVDLGRKRVVVGRSVAVLKGRGLVIGPTKTHQTRTVPLLTSALVKTVRKLARGRQSDALLFPGPDGGVMSPDFFTWRFSKAAKGLGLDNVTPHTLRHSAGSIALAHGASVVTVSKLLGHKDATTTLRVYAHVLPDYFDRLAEAMEKATTALQ